MKKVIIVAGLIICLLIAFVLWMGMPKGPKLAEVAHLKEARITTLPPQKVLLVTATGDPKTVAKNAFGLLMSTYFKLKGVPKGGPDFKAPRARWPLGTEVPPDQWIGRYAMPVAESITQLPDKSREKEGLQVELTTWEYGEVAEILHVGPWDKETPTILSLKSFIDQQGYEIAGEHEEEYLRGPGMIFPGNADNYLTIIRYQVRKKPIPADTSVAMEE